MISSFCSRSRGKIDMMSFGGPASTVPDGLNPAIQTREIVFDADVSMVTSFLKLATVSRGNAGHMTFASDEGPNLGGLGSADSRVIPGDTPPGDRAHEPHLGQF